jgi:hypothetical protein
MYSRESWKGTPSGSWRARHFEDSFYIRKGVWLFDSASVAAKPATLRKIDKRDSLEREKEYKREGLCAFWLVSHAECETLSRVILYAGTSRVYSPPLIEIWLLFDLRRLALRTVDCKSKFILWLNLKNRVWGLTGRSHRYAQVRLKVQVSKLCCGWRAGLWHKKGKIRAK